MIYITDESKEEKKTERQSDIRTGIGIVAVGVVCVGLYTYALGRKHGGNVGYVRGHRDGYVEAGRTLVDAINDYTKVQIGKATGGE